MDKSFQENIQQLYRQASLLMFVGTIEKPAYDLAIQVMARMVDSRCSEIVTTWSELAGGLVTRRVAGKIVEGQVIASAAPRHHYFLLGALQQAEECLGLVSHVDRIGLDAHLVDGREAKEFSHFTREPGVASDIIGPNTRLIFTYEPWVGETILATVREYVSTFGQAATLPKWVFAGRAVQ